jgi:hypothetical protein
MELTYENINAMLNEYFDALPTIEGPQDEARMMEYFSPDFEILWPYFNFASVVQNREEWVKHLCSHADVYRATVTHEPHPLGIAIDVSKKQATVIHYEEFLHPETKEHVLPRMFCAVVFEFCIHDGKVKAQSEKILAIPAPLEGV